MSAVHDLRPADEPAWLLRKNGPTPQGSVVASGGARLAGSRTDNPGSAATDADAGLFRFVRILGAALCRFIDRAGANQRQIDKYLSESTDLVDLERRVRDLDRNGWQFR